MIRVHDSPPNSKSTYAYNRRRQYGRHKPPAIDNTGRTFAELLSDLGRELDTPRRLRETITTAGRDRLTATVLADPEWFGRLVIFAAESARKARHHARP